MLDIKRQIILSTIATLFKGESHIPLYCICITAGIVRISGCHCTPASAPCPQLSLRELTAQPRMRRASPLARSVLKLGGWTENTADGDKTAACNLNARYPRYPHKQV